MLNSSKWVEIKVPGKKVVNSMIYNKLLVLLIDLFSCVLIEVAVEVQNMTVNIGWRKEEMNLCKVCLNN